MTSGLEAVGDAATGALLASTVEPHGRKTGEAGHGACPNCDTSLIGAYCHGCGQNSHLHRTIAGFGHDLLHGVFHFEGKIWHTLPLLFLKPGELTRRYIHGERVKFVSPLAGFLFCTFLMFAVVGGLAGEMHLDSKRNGTAGSAGDVTVNSPEDLRREIDRTAREINALKARIKTEEKAGRETTALEEQLEQLQDRSDALDKTASFVPGMKIKGQSGGSVFSGIHTGWAPLDHGIDKANENPNLFLYRLQSSAYKYSWALIPISTPLVWLLFFWKRQYKFYDHLVFVTFSLTFMTLLVTLLTVFGAIGLPAGFIVLVALIVPPLHMYKQLRGAYLIGRLSALLRTAVLVVMSSWALIAYFVGLLALGVFH